MPGGGANQALLAEKDRAIWECRRAISQCSSKIANLEKLVGMGVGGPLFIMGGGQPQVQVQPPGAWQAPGPSFAALPAPAPAPNAAPGMWRY